MGVYVSGFTSPAASPVALPARAAAPSVLAPGVPSLAAFVDLMMGKLAPPAQKGSPGDGKGQNGAGKILPNEDKPQVDPAFAWLFGAPPTPAPQPITVAPTLPTVNARPMPLDILTAAPPIPSPLGGREGLGVGGPEAVDASAPHLPTPNPSLPERGIVDRAPVLRGPQPNVLLVAPPATVALPAMFALGCQPGSEARDDEMPSSPTAATVTLLQPATSPVAPTGDAERQSLDLGRQDWPQKMIDHIEALRDNANANDTSIRLKPEALGRVDVSLKTHNDGAISVRFTADQPTTRTLLADAAPQLTAAAEARGIRLSGTSVDLSGQGDQRPRPETERQQNISNHLAAPRGDDSQAVDDGRIA